jgi:cation diffusion facilitator CzcD-associated flavoprotein CzcO
MSSSCEVAVVGAGPYGLSIAAHLKATTGPVRIFGRPMNTWRSHMPEGMFLKSEGFASSLSDPGRRYTLRHFCAETGRDYNDVARPVSLDTFIAYGDWFRERAVGDVDERDVVRVEDDPFGFVLELADGELVAARSVVVATGVMPFAYVPAKLRGLPHGLVTHASEHASFEQLRGRRVAVVGGGQSALETAVLLREGGALPQLVVRAPGLRWNPRPAELPRPLFARLREPDAPLGIGWKLWVYSRLTPSFRFLPEDRRVRIARTTLGPAGAWWLRDRLKPDVPVVTGSRIVEASPVGDGVRLILANGGQPRELEVDHAIAGTGYRIDLERLTFLAPELRSQLELVRDAPKLSRHFESSRPGLYFAGLPAAHTFGPAMRFVCGTDVAARCIAAHVPSAPAPAR